MKKAFLIVGSIIIIFGIIKTGFLVPFFRKFTPELTGQELGYYIGEPWKFYIGPILFILVGGFLVYQGFKMKEE